MRDLRTASDEDLLRATPRTPRAFDEFYVRHEALVLAYFRRRTESADVALDLTAETFVQALASVRRFRPGPEPAVAWLLGIARHTLLKSLRRGRVADRARRRLGVQTIAVEDSELERIDRLGSVSAAELLAALPPEQADAIRARVFDDASYGDVAARLRCSPLVARKRVSRGLATLREIVNEELVMTHVPALREALLEAAERRYGRRRHGRLIRRAAAVSALAAAAIVAVLSLGGGQPRDEATATPVPTPSPTPHTVKIEPVAAAPTPAGKPRFVEPKLLSHSEAKTLFKREGMASGTVERAWSTPGMQGEDAHVFLLRRGNERCLSVPDPSTDQAGDRGVGCSPERIWERYGVSLTIGSSYAAVVAPDRPAPTYRAPDGSHQTPQVAEGGLVALIDAAGGSAITLHGPGKARRTDAFRIQAPQEKITCSNGFMLLVPVERDTSRDPCSAMQEGGGQG